MWRHWRTLWMWAKDSVVFSRQSPSPGPRENKAVAVVVNGRVYVSCRTASVQLVRFFQRRCVLPCVTDELQDRIYGVIEWKIIEITDEHRMPRGQQGVAAVQADALMPKRGYMVTPRGNE